jgi:hypothetical protein
MDLLSRLREDGEIVTERLTHWAALDGDRPFFHYAPNPACCRRAAHAGPHVLEHG